MIHVPKRELVMPRRQRGHCIIDPYRFGGAAFTFDAADFDGTNDFISKSTAFSPAGTSSKTGIVSFWVKFDTGTPILIDNGKAGGGGFGLQIDYGLTVANKFTLFVNDFSTGANDIVLSSNTARATGNWYHFLSSWDLATATRHLYINDVSDLGVVTTFVNASVDWSLLDTVVIGDIIGTGFKLDGGLSEFYFAPSQFLDFSVVGNRRLFISATGHPVSLGVDGSTPTGTKPILYQHIDQAESANNFALNRTGKGDFTVTGALTTYATRP